MLLKPNRMPALLVLTLVLSFDVSAQVCGYSVNTFYVHDNQGSPVKNVTIDVFDGESRSEVRAHFTPGPEPYRISRVHWNDERKVYVYQHGLCGSHKNVVVRILAEGFEAADYRIDLPLDFRAYEVQLKRKGSNETALLKALSCDEPGSVCVKRLVL